MVGWTLVKARTDLTKEEREVLRSTQRLHILALIAVAVLGGLVAMASPSERLSIQVPDEPLATCPNEAVEVTVASLMDVQAQVGQPCCATLCEQVCGVGEPCLCKRCQVLGCGVS